MPCALSEPVFFSVLWSAQLTHACLIGTQPCSPMHCHVHPHTAPRSPTHGHVHPRTLPPFLPDCLSDASAAAAPEASQGPPAWAPLLPTPPTSAHPPPLGPPHPPSPVQVASTAKDASAITMAGAKPRRRQVGSGDEPRHPLLGHAATLRLMPARGGSGGSWWGVVMGWGVGRWVMEGGWGVGWGGWGGGGGDVPRCRVGSHNASRPWVAVSLCCSADWFVFRCCCRRSAAGGQRHRGRPAAAAGAQDVSCCRRRCCQPPPLPAAGGLAWCCWLSWRGGCSLDCTLHKHRTMPQEPASSKPFVLHPPVRAPPPHPPTRAPPRCDAGSWPPSAPSPP